MYGQVRGFNPVIRMGQVVSVDDPHRAGRSRVRLYGEMDDESAIPDDSLPWATALMPTTSPSLAGSGSSIGLAEGSRVLCMVLDYPDNQQIVVLGSHYAATDDEGSTQGNHYPPRAVAAEDRGPEPPRGQRAPPGGRIGNVGVDEPVRPRATRLIEAFKRFVTR